jgi:hypothetical protein
MNGLDGRNVSYDLSHTFMLTRAEKSSQDDLSCLKMLTLRSYVDCYPVTNHIVIDAYGGGDKFHLLLVVGMHCAVISVY